MRSHNMFDKKESQTLYIQIKLIQVMTYFEKYSVIILISEMQKSKPSSQYQTSTIRPVTISSNFKFDKVEKLNQIVQEVEYGRKETVGSEAQLKGERGIMSEKVLDVLKKRIKTNYEQLYNNYPDNKVKILKQIQTVETNISGQNVMKHKQEEVIKERAKYDKLKVIFEEKQKKLKKLKDLKAQLTHRGQADNTKTEEQFGKYQELLQMKENRQHNNLIVNEMLKQRKEILLTLQKRFNTLTEQIKERKDKSSKWRQANVKRKQMILRLQESLRQQEGVQIPGRLAEELSSKIEQYQNKHSYSNIIHHETILEQQRFQQMRQQISTKKELQRQTRMKKEKQEKLHLQELYNGNMKDRMEQYKLMRLCGVESIEEILNSDPNQDQQRLEEVDKEIENQIKSLQESNIEIQKEIQKMMSEGQIDLRSETVQELERGLEEEERERKLIQEELNQKRELTNKWQTLMHIANGNNTDREALDSLINSTINQQTIRKTQKTDDKKSKPFGVIEVQSIEFQ